MLGAPGCPWPSVSGQQLLDRHLGPLSFSRATLAEVVRTLLTKYHVPLSFVEAEPNAKLVLSVTDTTVAELLDLIVARIPGYRYGFVGARLVLFSTDPKWQTRIDDLTLGPGPRRKVSAALVVELRRRVPALSELGTPWTFGDPGSYVYQDQVAVGGPASVLELLTQVLGTRPSATFMVSTLGSASTSLWLESANLVRSVQLTALTTALRQRGQTVQLKVIGTLWDGAQMILTEGQCGTEYVSHDPKVVAVSPDGLVTAVGNGEARVVAFNENPADWKMFKVEFKREPGRVRRPASTPEGGREDGTD
jgi:hypothetical protein